MPNCNIVYLHGVISDLLWLVRRNGPFQMANMRCEFCDFFPVSLSWSFDDLIDDDFDINLNDFSIIRSISLQEKVMSTI